MGPVLEKAAALFEQGAQVVAAVGLTPRPQDHVMRAFDSIDTVDLHEPQPVDQRQKVRAPGVSRRWFDQGMAVKKEPPRSPVVQRRQTHAPQVRSSTASQLSAAILRRMASS